MDQKELKALEYKCIQEEPPECVAACPIHVDARSLIHSAAAGKWNSALKTLERAMPIPGILGRICDAPCQQRCKRGEVDDPIEIGALERACVEFATPPRLMPPIPHKDQKVAVVGTALSGLTVAWDLSKKGYAVTLFEPAASFGEKLLEAWPDRLTRAHLDEILAVLEKRRVHVEREAAVEEADFPSHLDGFDAIYLGLDAVSGKQWPIDRIDEKLQTTSRDGVFAGGNSSKSASSVIWRAAEGRFAATSMDRFLQGVSLSAGRNAEGPYPTRLFTSTVGIDSRPAVRPSYPKGGYSEAEAISEAERCLQCECLECVKVCPYLEHFRGYPRKYAREIYNNEAIVMGVRQANTLINSCSLCGLCEEVCPKNFAMQDVCLEARCNMVQRAKMPDRAHEFALLDMAFSQSQKFAMVRHEPGHDASRYAFFPGCQLCASSPSQVMDTYGHLRSCISDGVGLMLGCCCAPAYWAAREDLFQEGLGVFKANWERLGKPEMILACSTCLRTFRDHLKEVPVLSLWQVLEEKGLPTPGMPPAKGTVVAIHDPCTTRHDPETQETVRRLANRLGVTIAELPLSRDLTECCGFGGLMRNANPSVAKEVVLRRARQSEHDYLSYCAMCRDNLAGAGKRALHLLDLVFPPSVDTDPADRKRPDWSLRQDNREQLNERMRREIWRETMPDKSEAHRDIELVMAREVKVRLQNRRILKEDVQRVLYNAAQTGNAFVNEETGHYLASFKPNRVTFWVEYSPEGEGKYVIHNAYAHRMEARPA
jgi:glutamate synthase (NADPH) small chain